MAGFETQTDDGSVVADVASEEVWVATLVHHPSADTPVGERVAIAEGDTLVLGRHCACWSHEALDDGKISRRHLELGCRAGTLSVVDLGSRNGTVLNGAPVERAELREGDVLGIGGVLVLVHRGPRLSPRVSHEEIVGVGASCARVLHRVAIAAPSDVTVLVRGETGVGKELVASAIHRESGRSGRFVAVNCSALADGVVHSELFGHARGAFSGAVAPREGLVSAAARGTLLLDEIGDASPTLQGALLRLLEQREYRELGSNELLHTDARFVAATNVALDLAVARGSFRPDLASRLGRFVIDVPPLRERREDILPLAHHFARARLGGPVRLTRSLAQALLRYHWPANVRELASVVDQAVLEGVQDGRLVLSAELATRLEPNSGAIPVATTSGAGRRGVKRDRPTAEELHARFRELGNNARALAAELGVGRTTVYRWFREAGLDVGDLRDDG